MTPKVEELVARLRGNALVTLIDKDTIATVPPTNAPLLIEAADSLTTLSARVMELEGLLRYARPLLVKYAYTQGNRPDFVREITAPLDAALQSSPQQGVDR